MLMDHAGSLETLEICILNDAHLVALGDINVLIDYTWSLEKLKYASTALVTAWSH